MKRTDGKKFAESFEPITKNLSKTTEAIEKLSNLKVRKK